MECAKVEMDGDAGEREVWRDMLTRRYRWKQAAVGVHEPVKAEGSAKKVVEVSMEPDKKSSGMKQWFGLRRLFTSIR